MTTTVTTRTILTVDDAQSAKHAADQELADWRGRLADVSTRLTAARARAEGLAAQAAAATLEGSDPKGVRRERAVVFAEAEELELAQGMAAEKITALEAIATKAERRLLIALALERLDRLAEIAERVEALWSPLLDGLGGLVLAAEDAAGLLDKLLGSSRHASHAKHKAALTIPLLWRLDGFVELPPAFGVKKETLPEFFSYAQSRAKLERELTESDTKENGR